MNWTTAAIMAALVVIANVVIGLMFPGYREMLKCVCGIPGGKAGLIFGWVTGAVLLTLLFTIGWWVVLVWGLINLTQWTFLFLNRKELA